MNRQRLAVVTTHPIQYQAPLFRWLAAREEIDLTVFFCHLPDERQQGDGFGVTFKWDVPLLEGYHYEVLKNVSARPSVMRFRGCDTPEIASRIAHGGFDAVWVHGWIVKSCLQALRACEKNRVPCLVRGEANLLQPRPWWKRAIQRRLVRRFAGCLAIGQRNREFYLSHGVPPEKIYPSPYCVDNDRFAAAAMIRRKERVAWRAKWGLAPDDVVFLYCAKFIAKKRPLDLLEAAKIAQGAGARFKLLMVGDGELRPECEAWARQHALPVCFAGFVNQSELPAAYVAADCLVLPSDHGETWGLVVNEAMACGVPAIVSDQVGCAVDLVVPGETGAVFPCGDIAALADALAMAARSPATLARWGESACARVSRYSIEAAGRGVLRALASVESNQDRAHAI